MFTTPILLLIFNRPAMTLEVLNKIREVRPTKLFVSGDGPRPGKEGEDALCLLTREVATSIDWECDIRTFFREKNLGCKNSVSSGINWFFENVEEGIILEDDTVPDKSFFFFCQNLLKYYRESDDFMHIAGSNFQFGKKIGTGSYYYSKYSHIWGWATWRRAWKKYDVEMKDYPLFKAQKRINTLGMKAEEREYWIKIFDKVHNNEIDTWDFQWIYTVLANNGKCIVPNSNLISNIGFGSYATHTFLVDKTSNMAVKHIDYIIHPEKVKIYDDVDFRSFKGAYNPPITIKNWIRKYVYKYFADSFIYRIKKILRLNPV